MPHYRQVDVEVEALTFQELHEHGCNQEGSRLLKGVATGFSIGWFPVSYDHEKDRYVVTVGPNMVIMNRGEVIVASSVGGLHTVPEARFRKLYTPIVKNAD